MKIGDIHIDGMMPIDLLNSLIRKLKEKPFDEADSLNKLEIFRNQAQIFDERV
jgi:hypothetical protein